MSVYKAKGSRFYVYDFWVDSRRFLGPTKATSRRAAQAVEDAERGKARVTAAALKHAEAELKGALPLTLDVACGRWWTERGQHRADADVCWKDTERMLAHFGDGWRMDATTDGDVAKWVATRRGERVWGKKKLSDGRPAKLLSNARVNRSTVDCMRRIYGHARRKWKLAYANEPDWHEHRLPEAEERVRELSPTEQDAVTATARSDYEPVYRFARLSGLRLATCLLRKTDVKWDAGRIEVTGKGGKLNRVPLSDEIRKVLLECWDDHPEFVFTYRARRADKAEVIARGQRCPITPSGLKSQWKVDRRSGIKVCPTLATFRFHDNRHTAGTRILRSSRNLKVAQKLLNHSRITTTAKYAHVLEDEVLQAMNATPDNPAPVEKSRGPSRGKRREVA